MMSIQIAKFKLLIPPDSHGLPNLMLGKSFDLQQEYIRGRKESVLRVKSTEVKLTINYQHQHNCHILTDVKVNFTSKAPTVMVITLLSVSPNMGCLSFTCFWSHESQHNADKKSPDPFTHLHCFI